MEKGDLVYIINTFGAEQHVDNHGYLWLVEDARDGGEFMDIKSVATGHVIKGMYASRFRKAQDHGEG